MPLKQLLKDKKAAVCIIGLGYVGLPLAVSAAKCGFKVTGLDLHKEKVRMLNEGKNYIDDVDSDELQSAIKNDRLSASSDFSLLKNMDVIVICVPTPLDKYKDPDISFVRDVSIQVSKNMKSQTLVILESTTYPGTTEEVVQTEIEKNGLKAGKDYYLVFSPERVDPGNESFKTCNIPKVIGGLDPESSELAVLFYGSFVEKTHVVSSPRAAEMTKLLENIFRIVNISMVNELSLLTGRMGIDIWEVITAASTKPYGFMPFYPGPGSGGHCIPIDPFYLSWKAKEYDFFTRFISLAGEINDMMPHYVVTKVISALNSVSKSVRGSKILVLGVAYKKNIDDMRESPSLHIMKDLIRKGAVLSYNDDHIRSLLMDGKQINSVELNEKNVATNDLVLIVTDHSYYKEEFLVKHAKLIVDTRNLIKSREHKHVYRF